MDRVATGLTGQVGGNEPTPVQNEHHLFQGDAQIKHLPIDREQLHRVPTQGAVCVVPSQRVTVRGDESPCNVHERETGVAGERSQPGGDGEVSRQRDQTATAREGGKESTHGYSIRLINIT